MNEEHSRPSRPNESRMRLGGLDLRRLMAEGLPATLGGDVPEEIPSIEGLEVIRLLGAGGMGRVFLARQVSLDRYVAVKVLSRPGDVASQFFDRLEREAQSMAKVSHPNTVQVYDFIRLADGGAAVTMEWVDGGNLREIHLSNGNRVLDWREAVRIAASVASSLETAHEFGIVHRDVKPENVLLTENGTVKVTDFGLSRSVDADIGLTVTGVYVGTPGYMAPEQLKGGPVDGRTDIYALGTMLYEMLTGAVPQGHFDPPRKIRPEIPPALSELVMSCLRSDPDKRLGTVSEFLSRLEQIERPSRRTAIAAMGIGGALLAGGGFFAHSLRAPRFPESRTLRGEWEIGREAIRSNDDICVLAIKPDHPVESLNVKIRFARISGVYSIALFFKHTNGWVSCELSAWDLSLGGLQMVDGKDLREMAMPDHFIIELENGREYLWEVRIRPDTITNLVDGAVYLRRNIEGSQFDITFPWDWTMLDTDGETMAIGSFQSPTAFHSIEIEPVAS